MPSRYNRCLRVQLNVSLTNVEPLRMCFCQYVSHTLERVMRSHVPMLSGLRLPRTGFGEAMREVRRGWATEAMMCWLDGTGRSAREWGA